MCTAEKYELQFFVIYIYHAKNSQLCFCITHNIINVNLIYINNNVGIVYFRNTTKFFE